jgi:hypothetical protein
MRSTLLLLAVLALAVSLPGAAAVPPETATITVDGGFFVTPDQPVTAYVNYSTSCFSTHEVEVVPRAEGSLVRVIAVEACGCPGVFRPIDFVAELGTFPVGVHRVEFVVAPRDPRSNPLPCGPPVVRATTELVVSNSGSIHELRIEPAAPRPGQEVALAIRTICGQVWGTPEISGPPQERIIRLAPATSSSGAGIAPRLTPCGSDPRPTVPLGRLPAGVYRAVLLKSDGTTDVERRFVVAPEPDPSLLLLHDGRFRVRGTWRDPQGTSGVAKPGTLTNETGYLWFFQPDNVEAVVKVLDGCAVNGRYWVFAAGLTNVETHLTVEDTETGETWTHTNPLQTPFAPVQDTDALHGCETPPR